MESSKAVSAMPLIFFFPIVTAALTIGLVLFWVYAAMHIYTMGDTSIADLTDYVASAAGEVADVDQSYFNESMVYSQDDASDYLMVYHLFGLLWTNQVINALLMCSIAGGICSWYWVMDKTTVSDRPVWDAFKRTLRFHLGSCCFGGLIIAIVQMVRLALEYLDQKTKDLQANNPIMKVIMWCVKCALWCFEKCIKFISFQAYIIVAMKGKSFLPSVYEAFGLIVDNMARVATVNIVSNFLLILGKCGIIVFCTLMMFVMIENNEDIDSIVFPMIVVMILSYGVSSGFFSVYNQAIDTILMCFCVDCKENADAGQYYMSDSLLHYINSTKQHSIYKLVDDDADGDTTSASI